MTTQYVDYQLIKLVHLCAQIYGMSEYILICNLNVHICAIISTSLLQLISFNMDVVPPSAVKSLTLIYHSVFEACAGRNSYLILVFAFFPLHVSAISDQYL